MRVLLAEDEPLLAATLKEGLEDQHCIVDLAQDGETALAFARTYPYDALLLDWGLPKLDGASVCRQLRAGGLRTGIIMLTCRDAIDDRVMGLDSGADDYVVKPVHLCELMARLRAQTRREVARPVSRLVVADVQLDPASGVVERNGREIALARKEYLILEVLMRDPGRLFSKTELMDRAWPADCDASPESVRTHIKHLRKKLDAAGRPLIRTMHGMGYKIEA
ncbi:MAG: response regulator transcription factor [Cyanobacteria bacterium REEB65]|nr:response regulator transcription factor [Cyanobacteria bacterium REEB65]